MLRVLVVQNEESDPPGRVEGWLAEAGVSLDIIRAYAGESVPVVVPPEYSGVMAFGGAMDADADEAHPWLVAERALMQDAVNRDIPVFGVCLGGQLLAASAGATVERSPHIEIGLSSVDIDSHAAQDEVFGELAGRSVPAAQWHQDWIVGLPATATVLAGNAAAPVQAFRLGQCAYGVQFHPEVDAATFASWQAVADEAARKSGVDVAAAAAEIADAEEALMRTWRGVFHNWAKVVSARGR